MEWDLLAWEQHERQLEDRQLETRHSRRFYGPAPSRCEFPADA
jgi:hypothetical protein